MIARSRNRTLLQSSFHQLCMVPTAQAHVAQRLQMADARSKMETRRPAEHIKPRIAIVGGGMAGLAALTTLCKSEYSAGLDIVLLECSDKLGGRCRSQEISENGFIDLGATFIHGTSGNVIYDLAKMYGVLEHEGKLSKVRKPAHECVCRLSNGEDIASVYRQCLRILYSLQQEWENGSSKSTCHGEYRDLYHYYHSNFFERANEKELFLEKNPAERLEALEAIFRNTLLDFGSVEGSPECKNVSLCTKDTYEYLPGNAALGFPPTSCYEKLIEKMAAELPGDCVHLGTEVQSVRWTPSEGDCSGVAATRIDETATAKEGTIQNLSTSTEVLELVLVSNNDFLQLSSEVGGNEPQPTGGQVKLITNRGTYQFDHVILTFPLGVLQASFDKPNLFSDDHPLFLPNLPCCKIEAIRGIGIDLVNKVFVEFPDGVVNCSVIQAAWLSTDAENDEEILSEFPWITSLSRLDRLHDTDMFVGWLVGEPALQGGHASPKQLAAGITYFMKMFYSRGFNSSPVRVFTSHWEEKHIQSAYSFCTNLNSQHCREVLAEPVGSVSQPLQLLFAGEATHSRWYSTAHGAYDSGVRQAKRILKHYH